VRMLSFPETIRAVCRGFAQCKLGMAYFEFNLVIGLTQIISICNINDGYNNLL